MDEIVEIILEDPVSSVYYQVLVGSKEAERAQADPSFASTLLKQAQSQHIAETSSREPQVNNSETSFGQNVADESIEDDENNNGHDCVINERAERNTTNDRNSETNSGMHVWNYEEVLQLIASYETHMDELTHPKKRKYVWENISNDLLSAGYSVTAVQCMNKWSNLLRSYKLAKDTMKDKNSTGRARSRFQFLDRMDDVVGTKPSNSASGHTMSSLPSRTSQQNQQQEAPAEDLLRSCQQEDLAGGKTTGIRTANRSFEDVKENSQFKSRKNSNEPKRKCLRDINCERKQARCDAMIAIEKEKLEVEKAKLSLLEKYLRLKEAGK